MHPTIKLAIAGLCATTALAYAQTDACLETLKGDFYHGEKTVPNHVFTVRNENSSWAFKRPESFEADKDKLFKYSFGPGSTAPAQPIQKDQLTLLGNALFTQYLDKAADIKGIRFECGLITDEFYLVVVDLSDATPRLIDNMIMMTKALAQDKNYKAKPTASEVEATRKLKFFSGQPFKMEGVASGVISFALQKP